MDNAYRSNKLNSSWVERTMGSIEQRASEKGSPGDVCDATESCVRSMEGAPQMSMGLGFKALVEHSTLHARFILVVMATKSFSGECGVHEFY